MFTSDADVASDADSLAASIPVYEKPITPARRLAYQRRSIEVLTSFEPRASESSTIKTEDWERLDSRYLERINRTVIREPTSHSKHVVTSFITLQEWEGYIDEIDQDKNLYRARLRPIRGVVSDPSVQYADEAEFDLEELSPFDRSKVVPGAVIRWSVGYDYVGYRRRNAHRITFR